MNNLVRLKRKRGIWRLLKREKTISKIKCPWKWRLEGNYVASNLNNDLNIVIYLFIQSNRAVEGISEILPIVQIIISVNSIFHKITNGFQRLWIRTIAFFDSDVWWPFTKKWWECLFSSIVGYNPSWMLSKFHLRTSELSAVVTTLFSANDNPLMCFGVACESNNL